MSCQGFRLQPSWNELDENEQAWFSYSSDGISQCYKLNRTEKGFDVIDSIDFNSIHYPPPTKHLSCMDVSPSGQTILSCTSDHEIQLWEAKSGTLRRKLAGHEGEIYSCRFFPSGLAALTAGADMQLKIWCLLTGQCAAVLAPGIAGARTGSGLSDSREPGGHRSGIIDTGIIDRGRNLLAVDRNGWLRLWDVSTQTCISAMQLSPNASRCRAAIGQVAEEASCLAVKQQQSSLSFPYNEPNDEELRDQGSWYKCYETASSRASEISTSATLAAVGMTGRASIRLYEIANRQKGCALQLQLPQSCGSIESLAFPVKLESPLTISDQLQGDDLGGDESGLDRPTNSTQELTSPSSSDPEENGSSNSVFLDYGLVAGGQNGQVAAWDMRQPGKPLLEIGCDQSAVLHLQAAYIDVNPRLRLALGRSDGRIHVLSCDPLRSIGQSTLAKPALLPIKLELTGIDCEPCQGLVLLPSRHRQGLCAWTASRAGVFRCYERLYTRTAFAL